MNKNNKDAGVGIVLLIILILGAVVWYFIPKNFFTKAKTASFGSFKNDKRKQITGVPSPLKWTRSFAYEKEGQKKSQSYMRYMTDKKKSEK